MSRSKHRQHGAKQWNPPPIPPDVKTPFSPPQNVVSATDCTGLEAQPVLSHDLSEINFHRT